MRFGQKLSHCGNKINCCLLGMKNWDYVLSFVIFLSISHWHSRPIQPISLPANSPMVTASDLILPLPTEPAESGNPRSISSPLRDNPQSSASNPSVAPVKLINRSLYQSHLIVNRYGCSTLSITSTSPLCSGNEAQSIEIESWLYSRSSSK